MTLGFFDVLPGLIGKAEKSREREGNRLIYQNGSVKLLLKKRSNPKAEGRG